MEVVECLRALLFWNTLKRTNKKKTMLTGLRALLFGNTLKHLRQLLTKTLRLRDLLFYRKF